MDTVTTVTKQTHNSNSYWNRCCKRYHVTPEKVAQISATILAICVASIVVSALMIQYPQASQAFFTIFSVVGFLSLIAMSVACGKWCRKPQKIQTHK